MLRDFDLSLGPSPQGEGRKAWSGEYLNFCRFVLWEEREDCGLLLRSLTSPSVPLLEEREEKKYLLCSLLELLDGDFCGGIIYESSPAACHVTDVLYRPGWSLAVEEAEVVSVIGEGDAAAGDFGDWVVGAEIYAKRTVGFVSPVDKVEGFGEFVVEIFSDWGVV